MKRIAALLLAIVASGFTAGTTPGGVPQLINYQGVLTDPGGTAVTDTLDMTFTLYPDSVAADSVLWAETHSNVIVNRGLFHVILGSTNPVTEGVFDGSTRWIGITVVGESEMTPRMRLTAVPFAFRAAVADTAAVIRDLTAHSHSALDASDGDPSAVLRVDSLGNTDITGSVSIVGDVGIGTNSPSAQLDVVGVLKTTGFRMPTGATENYVLTSDSTGTATWKSMFGSRVPDIKYADQYPGANAGERIAAALLDLPMQGGIVDARGFSGEQLVNKNMFAGLDKDIVLLLGAATYTFTVGQFFNSDQSSLSIVGQTNATLIVPSGSMDVFRISCDGQAHVRDLRIDLNNTGSTAIFLERSDILSVIERIYVTGVSGAPAIKIGAHVYHGPWAYNVKVRDCRIAGSGSPIGIEVNTLDCTIEHCSFWFLETAVLLGNNVLGVNVLNSDFDHCSHAVVSRGIVGGFMFMGNATENNSLPPGAIVHIEGAADNPSKGIIIQGNNFAQINEVGEAAVYLENVEGAAIVGNAVHGGSPGQSFILGENVSQLLLAGNYVDDLSPVTTSFGLSLGGDITIEHALRLKPDVNAARLSDREDVYERFR